MSSFHRNTRFHDSPPGSARFGWWGWSCRSGWSGRGAQRIVPVPGSPDTTARRGWLFRSVLTLWILPATATALAQDFDTQVNPSDAEGILDPTHTIYIGNADGSNMKPATIPGDYVYQQSPCWSRDGKWIAYESWRPMKRESQRDSKIFIVSSDGGKSRLLGDGAMPSFSPRGKRIVFSRQSMGVWVMSSEGPDEELVQLEQRGTSPKWSPDGRCIAFVSEDQPPNLVVLNLVEGDRTLVFNPKSSPYARVNKHFAWSPDSKRIAFHGTRADNTSELAIVDVRGADFGLESRVKERFGHFLSWSPDGSRIVLSTVHRVRNRSQVYFVDLTTSNGFELLPQQIGGRINHEAAYSPDGTQLAISSGANSIVATTDYTR